MLRLNHAGTQVDAPAAARCTRREWLRVGGLALGGLTLADLTGMTADVRQAAAASHAGRSAIFIWLNGGPSHFETFDPKPDAPDAVRGPYGAIDTSVAGVKFCELLPELSRHAHLFSVIRSVTHNNAGHDSTAMLAGFEGGTTAFGAVATRLLGGSPRMPSYMHIGSRRGNGTVENANIDRVGGGEFGGAYEPIVIRDPLGRQVDLGEFTLSGQIGADRFHQRRELLGAVDAWRAKVESTRAMEEMERHYRQAVELLTSSRVRDAFDLEQEPDSLRWRYGANFFGQSCLLARRLIEAGTRFVQVKWYDAIAFDAWDVHGAELPGMSRMEQQLCPRLDQGLSGLLTDLHERGMLGQTLVVVAGEFGRTPQINKFGARDHWPFCFSAVMAGAGIPGGTIVGSSDAKGAFPASRPVRPEEFAATVYQTLGIDVVRDLRVRPFIKDAVPVEF